MSSHMRDNATDLIVQKFWESCHPSEHNAFQSPLVEMAFGNPKDNRTSIRNRLWSQYLADLEGYDPKNIHNPPELPSEYDSILERILKELPGKIEQARKAHPDKFAAYEKFLKQHEELMQARKNAQKTAHKEPDRKDAKDAKTAEGAKAREERLKLALSIKNEIIGELSKLDSETLLILTEESLRKGILFKLEERRIPAAHQNELCTSLHRVLLPYLQKIQAIRYIGLMTGLTLGETKAAGASTQIPEAHLRFQHQGAAEIKIAGVDEYVKQNRETKEINYRFIAVPTENPVKLGELLRNVVKKYPRSPHAAHAMELADNLAPPEAKAEGRPSM